jgi:adenylosuccinate synthase
MKNKIVNQTRKNSFAFCGGSFGDEGKGRIIDKFVSDLANKGPIVVYRDNGGSNSGHTVEFANGKRFDLHQLPSGVFIKNAIVILGKGMVLHPGDLIEEIKEVKRASEGKIRAKILVDEMAVLALDTHRAFESVLKEWQEGGRGSTSRGISPAYADVLLRHPLRMRDLFNNDLEKISLHYKLYQSLISGLGRKLSEVPVPALNQEKNLPVGNLKNFLSKLNKQRRFLSPYIKDVYKILQKSWSDNKVAFVCEKAQGIGLDSRYGVYPDVTSSDCAFAGILHSSGGIIDPDEIEIKSAVIKATYMTSVGTRKLPAPMNEKEAIRIREDLHEYGTTTKRPRNIIYFDLPAIKYFMRVGKANSLILTHMDVVYPKTPIKICTAYKINGKEVSYRPDQEFLKTVKPKFVSFPVWSRDEIQAAKTTHDIPTKAKKFLKFISTELGLPILMITTGPKREQGIIFKQLLNKQL